MERATALFLDCCGDADAFVLAQEEQIETVVGGEAFRASAALDWTTAEIAAVTDANGQRCALITIARPAYDGADGRPDPLLDAAIEASPAIVWLKDLDGRYLRVNRQYVEQLRTSADHVRGKTDGELKAGESIERLRLQGSGKAAKEPLELEYMVDAVDGLPAFAVLRFALRDVDGKPSLLCGVAAALGRAEVARSECRRFMRLARWRGSDESAIRAGLIAEWGLKPVSPSEEVRPERLPAEREASETDNDQFAALAVELDAALETSARLDQDLAEERRQVIALREASVLSARRAQELLRSVTAERTRSAELEESLARAEGRAAELERELERLQTTTAALAREQRTVETLRDELRAAEEEVTRVRRAASEAVAQAPTQDELDQERRRADQANAALTSLRARAEMAEAEAKSVVAQARSELRRSNEEGTAASDALTVEKQQVASLHAKLTELRDELEATRRDLTKRPTAEELEQERSRTEWERSRAEQQLARAQEAEASAEQARRELAQRPTSEELTAVREELERTRHAEPVGQSPVSSDELERAHMRAAEAEAALRDQRVVAEQAAVRAEEERTKAAAAFAAAQSERETAQSLRAELSAAQAELEREQSRPSTDNTAESDHDPPGGPPIPTEAPGTPVWPPASQHALSAALSAVDDWRTALKQAVKTIGEEGGWDAVVAWCPDRRRKLMQCVAMWGAEATISSTFETRVWQHRPQLPDERGSAWRPPAPATSLVNLETASDALLRAAAGEGIGSAVLVPIHDGTQLIGTIQFMSRHATPPTVELMLSLEGVALQLATIARLLEASSTPNWRAAGF